MSTFAKDLLSQVRGELARVLRIPVDAVYAGREPQRVTRNGFEVWIKPLPMEPRSQIRVHALEVHVRMRSRREDSQTGADQLDRVASKLEDVRERFDGARTFIGALPTLVAMQADPGAFDTEPDDPDLIDGVVVLRVLEH